MPVVVTAGHVDHGKSTLVEALTGRNPDRWAEERRRGMTIDLGFAWTHLGGLETGFIDVPGHERFIKNMLVGVEGVDAALFVVAADEGWMPQSEEHLAILDLIGVDRGVVALTRADLVDSETLELAEIEVAEQLAGTSLEGVAILPVAAPRGEGLEALRTALAGLVAPAPDLHRPRLWVDRAFTIGGAGTVVTGTLVGGTISVDDVLMLYPDEREVRVRGLHNHDRPMPSITPGNRAAVNLAGVGRDEVARGAMLGLPGRWRSSDRIVVDLRLVRSPSGPLRDRGSFHVHIGSGSHPARLSLVDDPPGAALLRLATPVPVAAGQHVVLREVGRRAVVAGGVVLDPRPPPRRRQVIESLPRLRTAATPDERADALLATRRSATLGELAADSGGGTPDPALMAGDLATTGDEARRIESAAVDRLDRYHRENPLRPGMPLPTLATSLRLPAPLLEAVVTWSDRLARNGAVVHLVGFGGGLDESSDAAWQPVRKTLEAAGAAPPRRGELGLDEELIHALLRRGDLVAVSEDLLYLPETIAGLTESLKALPEEFSVADFRDALEISRKHAIPLLEWMDRAGVTRRSGDLRRLLPPPPADSPPGAAQSP